MSRFDRPQGDAGIALITVVLMGALLAGMGVAIASTTVKNLSSAGRDRVGASALGVAEAGVADAIGYIRTKGVRQLCGTCSTAWNTTAPVTRVYANGSAVVSISEVTPYSPPATRAGRYLIRSVGTTPQSLPGRRTVEQLVEVKPLAFPLGVYVNGHLDLNGQVKIQQESVLSSSCIDSRGKLRFQNGPLGSNLDPYYQIPAGAHSASYITATQQGSCVSSVATEKQNDPGAIHSSSTCNTTYPYDQDATPLGGAFPGSGCATATGGYGDYATKGSEFSAQTLVNDYGFKTRGLTSDEYATLKAKAIAGGTFFGAGQSITWPTASTNVTAPGYSPVIYIEDQNVSITNQLNSYGWVSDLPCTSIHPNFVLVVERGNLSVGSSSAMTGYIFAPDGRVDYTGGAELTGTMFAKDMKLGGGGSAPYNIGLNECMASYTNGGILAVTKVRFREVDDAYNE